MPDKYDVISQQAFDEAEACAEYFRQLREQGGPMISLSSLTGPGSSLTLGGEGGEGPDLTSVPAFTKMSPELSNSSDS